MLFLISDMSTKIKRAFIVYTIFQNTFISSKVNKRINRKKSYPKSIQNLFIKNTKIKQKAYNDTGYKIQKVNTKYVYLSSLNTIAVLGSSASPTLVIIWSANPGGKPDDLYRTRYNLNGCTV